MLLLIHTYASNDEQHDEAGLGDLRLLLGRHPYSCSPRCPVLTLAVFTHSGPPPTWSPTALAYTPACCPRSTCAPESAPPTTTQHPRSLKGFPEDFSAEFYGRESWKHSRASRNAASVAPFSYRHTKIVLGIPRAICLVALRKSKYMLNKWKV